VHVKKLVIIIIVVALLAAVYFLFSRANNKGPEISYVTVPVERGALKAEVTCTGTLKPLVEVLVGSQVSGTIKELYADFESPVKKNQLVALIDPDLFEAKVGQAKADLLAAQAALEKSIVTSADEQRTLKRKETLLEKNSISQSEFDTVKTKADAAEAQVAVDRARVVQMEAKLREAELQLTYTRIIAPVDGVVTARNMDVGQTVAASFQAPVIFKLAEDLRHMQVHTNVDEADVGRVQVGQKAVFTVPAFPEDSFTASVGQIRNDPKIEQNVVTYNVVLDVENNDLKLRPGMTANVNILLEEATDTLMVPEQTFRFTPGTGKRGGEEAANLPALQPGQKVVWKLEADNRIKPVVVKTGIVGMQNVQITSDQLKAGDRIVVDAVMKDKTKAASSRMRIRF